LFDRKEQAKIFLERIKGDAKTVNTTLVLFVPILIFLLLSLGRNYPLVQQRVAGLRLRMERLDTKKVFLEKVKTYSGRLNNQYQNLGADPSSTNPAGLNRIDALLGSRKKAQSQLSRNKSRLRNLNDSLARQLDQLNFSVELPIIKQKHDFTIRTIVVVTMALLTALCAYVYRTRMALLRYLYKLSILQKQGIKDGTTPPFRNHAYAFPFWFFPIPLAYFRNPGSRLAGQLMGLNEKGIRLQNWFAVSLLLLFLVLNIVLCIANWNINYKAYHQPYSPLIALGMLLLFADVALVYAIAAPLLRQTKKKRSVPAAGMSRGRFIALAGGTGAAVFFEPVVSTLGRGCQWFNNPRFVHNKKSIRLDIASGLYKIKHKASRIYFFNDKKTGVLKSVAEPARFKRNLRLVNEDELLTRTDWLQRLRQQDLVRYFSGEPRSAGLLKKLDVYVRITNQTFSPQFLDLYTKVSVQNKAARQPEAHQKIKAAVNRLNNNPVALLPAKYQRPPKYQKNISRWTQTRQELLLNNICKRIMRWEERLT
jgi:hypothetical protein